MGTQRVASDDEDAPIELTHKSMVLRDKKFVLAMKKRTEAYGFDKYWADPSTAPFLDFAPIAPAASPRHCEVHKCVLIEGDEPCAEGRAECEGPRGHLRSFGEQMDLQSIEEHHAALLPDAPYFWREHVAKYKPVLLRGAASKVTNLTDWSDEALLSARDDADHLRCELKGGGRWWVTVEKNNRISHNDRFPLAEGYDFCRFIREYRHPDAPTYCIHSITDTLSDLPTKLSLPGVLACNELYNSMHAVRMWFSRGNTTSSQHFDTHDNLMLQIDGIKDIYLSHPNESAKMYMDHHDKYGLSPLNVDRVDLERFPHVANASVQHVRLMPGDAVYIPDGYWHVIKSTDRNLALAFEINTRRLAPEPWTPALNELYEHPGTLWAEQRKIMATMKEAWARDAHDEAEWTQCKEPLAKMPASLADYNGWVQH